MSTKRLIANINNEQAYNVKAGFVPAFIFIHLFKFIIWANDEKIDRPSA